MSLSFGASVGTFTNFPPNSTPQAKIMERKKQFCLCRFCSARYLSATQSGTCRLSSLHVDCRVVTVGLPLVKRLTTSTLEGKCTYASSVPKGVFSYFRLLINRCGFGWTRDAVQHSTTARRGEAVAGTSNHLSVGCGSLLLALGV